MDPVAITLTALEINTPVSTALNTGVPPQLRGKHSVKGDALAVLNASL